VKKQEYLEQHFIDIRRGLMVQLLQKRDRKETRNCESCGKPKMKSYFYDWYSAFDGSFLAVVCLNCAKRETGSKHKLER